VRVRRVRATGDLTRRKLMPAIYQLCARARCDAFALVGVSRARSRREAFAQAMIDAVRNRSRRSAPTADRSRRALDYVTGEFADAATYDRCGERSSARSRARHRGQPAVLPRDAAVEFETILSSSAAGL
jgi:glucose-6-phosphate 1-dehydrogenase